VTLLEVKSSIILSELAQIFFFTCTNIKIILNFVKFDVAKQGRTTNFVPPPLLLLLLDPGSGMDKSQNPGHAIQKDQD
jgi:hypothetical protein